MGEVIAPYQVLLFCGAIMKPGVDVAAVQERLEAEFGPVVSRSDIFPFDLTTYYEPEMGAGLLKAFFSFEKLIEQDAIVDIKLRTNEIEEEILKEDGGDNGRPVNLDPGYVTYAKVTLATTKDNFHRVYLGKGIYVEVTLHYREKTFRPFDWTYPDFKKDEYIQYFNQLRRDLRERAKKNSSTI